MGLKQDGISWIRKNCTSYKMKIDGKVIPYIEVPNRKISETEVRHYTIEEMLEARKGGK